MSPMLSSPPFLSPSTAAEALAALSQEPTPILLAGGTWVMRAPLRHEARAARVVSLARIDALHRFRISDDSLSLGALVTHDRLSRLLPDAEDLRGLRQAALGAANPGVRRLATLGGNLCATSFAAADLGPALLVLDAEVALAGLTGTERMPVEAFLAQRDDRQVPWLLAEVTIRRDARRFTAHQRLPMRQAGDYPCVIASVSTGFDRQGRFDCPRIAVGAVEARARQWATLEQALQGTEPLADGIEALARQHLPSFDPREGPDVPGWYRLSVLPVLVRRAFGSIVAAREGTAWS